MLLLLMMMMMMVCVCVCVWSDLADASPTSNTPCSSQRLCQSAHIQNLAGCDAATVSCVCERGYDLDRGVCMGQCRCVITLRCLMGANYGVLRFGG